MKQIKDVEGSFDSSGWKFGLLLSNSRIIKKKILELSLPFGRKKFWHISPRNLYPVNKVGWRN